jgi:alpha-beta hydrolase superfamily lysophospholipase
MGGAAALQMAARSAPDLLILLAPFVRINDRRATLLPVAGRFVKEVKLLANMNFDDPIIRQWLRAALPDLEVDDPEIQRRLREETGVSASVINELRKFGNAGRRAAFAVGCPVVVIQGHQDSVVNPRDSRRLCDAFTNLQAYHEISGDHLLTLATVPWWPRVLALVLDEVTGLQPFAPSGQHSGGGVTD